MVRGVDRAPVFQDDRDRARFLDHLRRLAPEEGVSVYAWALMPNHVHLVARSGPAGISRFMARLGTGHARAFNGRHDRVGHLFQDRFRSVLVEDDSHRQWLVRYVHRNPLEAGLVGSLDELDAFVWTGHRELLGATPAPLIDVDAVLSWFAPDRRAATTALRRFMADRAEVDAPAPEALHDPDLLRRIVDSAVEAAARRFAVDPREIWRGSRRRAVSLARTAAIDDLHHRVGLRPAQIERAMGLSGGSAAHALARARTVFKK